MLREKCQGGWGNIQDAAVLPVRFWWMGYCVLLDLTLVWPVHLVGGVRARTRLRKTHKLKIEKARDKSCVLEVSVLLL